MGPAKADGLVPQFSFNVERTLGVAGWDGIAHHVSSVAEAGIIGSVAYYSDIGFRSLLLETVRQQAVVLQVSNTCEQAGGHAPALVFDNAFVNLHLIAAVDLAIM